MKKKILFVMNNLNCGGAEKALVSLMQNIDYSNYEVDLYLFKHEGLFLKQLPKEVTLLKAPLEYVFFDMPFFKALLLSLKMGRLDIFFGRIGVTYVYKSINSASAKEQKAWNYISKCIPKIDKKYDLSVGYLQRMPNYFCVDKTNAVKKVGFVHNDYEKLKMDISIDSYYMNQLDAILTVSETCEAILMKTFPQHSHKIAVMFNIVSPKIIQTLSNAAVTMDTGLKTIVTVGRLNKQKGYELSIEACGILKKQGIIVKWYVLGDGEERATLEMLIKEHDVEENFILLGIVENPYPYIKQATIYVQTSRFEGKSIAIDEAKILDKPIVVTNFETVFDQIESEINGIIVPMIPTEIANGIRRLFEDTPLRDNLVANLRKEKKGNESEIEVFYKMIEN